MAEELGLPRAFFISKLDRDRARFPAACGIQAAFGKACPPSTCRSARSRTSAAWSACCRAGPTPTTAPSGPRATSRRPDRRRGHPTRAADRGDHPGVRGRGPDATATWAGQIRHRPDRRPGAGGRRRPAVPGAGRGGHPQRRRDRAAGGLHPGLPQPGRAPRGRGRAAPTRTGRWPPTCSRLSPTPMSDG